MNRRDQGERRITANTGASADLEGLLIDFTGLLPGDVLLFRSIDQKKLQEKISTVAIYLGNNEIAESNYPKVRIRKLSETDKDNQVIGVLRSQCGFSEKRAAALRNFVQKLIDQGAGYDWRGALAYKTRKVAFIEKLLSNLEKNYGKITPENEFAKRSYFCSALVVACYTLSGVIGDNAQVAYPPDVLSPGDLHRDPTFGWFLGYIIKERQRIALDDPLLTMTLWKDNQEIRWWQ